MLNIPARDPRAVALVEAIHGGDVQALQRRFEASPELASARVVDSRGVARTLAHIAADWPGHFPNGAEVIATRGAPESGARAINQGGQWWGERTKSG